MRRPASFDRADLDIKPLRERRHNLDISVVRDLETPRRGSVRPGLRRFAGNLIASKRKGASIIMIIGAHVIRAGVQRYIIDLLRRGYISCIAVNGASMIHDFEFAMAGATTESVADYIKTGQFGLWRETAYLNDIINRAYMDDSTAGMGEAVGRFIAESDFPHKDISVFSEAYLHGVPVTVHVGMGYDIIHEHPNCDGAATGALSYNDFLRFAKVVQGLEHGAVMSFGSSVMAPEVFLKALSMARNAARRKRERINRFSTLVCDLVRLPGDFSKEPPRTNPAYYFRPWKTLLVRTVADGGESFYVRGRHEQTVPGLWAEINRQEAGHGKGD